MSTAPRTPRRLPDEPDRSSLRLKLITLGAIVVVGLAGGVAVSANIGILDAADDSGVGSVSAAGDLTPSTQVVDVYLDDTTSSAAPTTVPATTTAETAPASSPAPAAGQAYAVDTAGTVTVGAVAGALQLAAVQPNPGWTWQVDPSTATELIVTFQDGTRTLHFVATLAADGSVTARVDEPVVAPAASTAPSGGYDDGEHDDDGQEDDGHEDDGHEDDGHEGGEDDD